MLLKLPSLRGKRNKVVHHGIYVTFHMVGVALPRLAFADILSLITRLAGTARAHMNSAEPSALANQGEVCLGTSKSGAFQLRSGSTRGFDCPLLVAMAICCCRNWREARPWTRNRGDPANVG